MPNSSTSRIVIPPLVWNFLLLLISVLLIELIVANLFIPSPNDVPYDRTYHSNVPGFMVAGFFNRFSILRGWYQSYRYDIYNSTFADDLGEFFIPPEGCASHREMYLQVQPISLFRSRIHVEGFEITICGHNN